MSKILITTLVCSLGLSGWFSCSSNQQDNNEHAIQNCNKFSYKDSILISTQIDLDYNTTINKYLKGVWNKTYFSGILNIAFVGPNQISKRTPMHFIIKECADNKAHIYVLKGLEPFSWMDILDYDSLTRAERKQLINPRYGDSINFSNYFLNIHNYRIKNKKYEYYVENKIKNNVDTFETFINNLKGLKVSNLTYLNKIDLIKNLFITIYIQSYFLEYGNAYPFTPFYVLNQRNIRQIENEEDVVSFIELVNNDYIEDVPLAKSYKEIRQGYLFNGEMAYPLYNTDPKEQLKLHFTAENKKFLRKKTDTIKKDYLEDNVFYFYSLPDIKLFRLEIRFDKLKGYSLSGEYMNHQFIWPNFSDVIEPVFYD